MSAVVLMPFVRRPRWGVRMTPLVAAFVLMTVTYLSAITLTTAANAIWLQATAPFWVFLFARFFLREQAQLRDWFLLGCGMAGVVAAVPVPFSVSKRPESCPIWW